MTLHWFFCGDALNGSNPVFNKYLQQNLCKFMLLGQFLSIDKTTGEVSYEPF